MQRISRFIQLLALAMGLCLGVAANAQLYPNRDITFVVPYGPGGSTDPISRYFSSALEKILKTNVNVENKPGGSASIGTSAVVRAKPDGYTIGLGTNASLAYQPLINKTLIYKSTDDYATITKLVDLPTLIIVRQDAPWKNFDEWLADVRKRPGKMRVSVSGVRTAPDLAIQELNKVANVKIASIPFSGGGGEAVIAMLSGRVETLATQAPGVVSHVQAGNARVLAAFMKGSYYLFPDAASIVDAGYNVTLPAAYGVIAPKGMPKEITDRLVAASLEIAKSAEFNEFAKKHGYLVDAQGPEAFRKELDQYSVQFAELLKFLDKK